MSTESEFVPGMREQGKGIKVYVESDYAPLKACLVGNPSAIMIMDPDTYEMSNLFAHETKEFIEYLRKHKGQNLKDAHPEAWEKMAMESDALAKAYRDAGVRVIRNETGETPEGVINYNWGWSKQKNMSLYGQSALAISIH